MIRSRLSRFRRGQATVELSVLCIVLVPLIMYVLFLDDLLRYKLDAAEAVYAAPWDFTTVDYEAGPDLTNIQRQIRRGQCDHTTAYNSYDPSYDCTEGHHHTALAAHACWITKPGGQQVTCTMLNDKLGQDPFDGSKTGQVKTVNKGGQIRCTARLGVMNYFLPQRVLADFTNVKMTTTTYEHGNDIHGDAAKLGAMGNYYPLERQYVSILTDTWAMTTVVNVDRNSNGGVLYDRVKLAYPDTGDAEKFGKQAKDDKLLSQLALVDGPPVGDDISTPQVGFTTDHPPEGDLGFFLSPWKDKSGDKTEASFNDRGSVYFGLKSVP